jgi:hypothetical protein
MHLGWFCHSNPVTIGGILDAVSLNAYDQRNRSIQHMSSQPHGTHQNPRHIWCGFWQAPGTLSLYQDTRDKG